MLHCLSLVCLGTVVLMHRLNGITDRIRIMTYLHFVSIAIGIMLMVFAYVGFIDLHHSTWFILYSMILLLCKCIIASNLIHYLQIVAKAKDQGVSTRLLNIMCMITFTPWILEYLIDPFNGSNVLNLFIAEFLCVTMVIIAYLIYIAPLRVMSTTLDDNINILSKYGLLFIANLVSFNLVYIVIKQWFGPSLSWAIIDSMLNIIGIAMIHGTPSNLHDEICCHSHERKCVHFAEI